MTQKRPDPLAEVLGQAPPASVAALPAADRARLAELVTAARRRTEREGAEAAERAVHGVPQPLRDLVLKALS